MGVACSLLHQNFHIKMTSETRSSFDHNPMGIFIHLVCIWNLFWSFMALLHFIPPLAPAPAFLANLPHGHLIAINVPLILSTIWVLFWILLEPLIGFIGSLLTVSCYFLTSYLVQQSPEFMEIPLFKALLGFHIFCWILQFIGHAVFEGRAPALLQSLDQAFITAPLFVLLEVS